MSDYPPGVPDRSTYRDIAKQRKQDKIQREDDWFQLLEDSGIPMKLSKAGTVVTLSDPKWYYRAYKTKFHLKTGRWVRGLQGIGDPKNRTFTGGAEKFIEWYKGEVI